MKPINITIDTYTQQILRSFKNINREIVFNTEETSVVHPEEKIIGLCKTFKMPVRFALTSLNRLLSALKWADTDTAQIFEDHMLVESAEEGDNKKSQRIHFHDNYQLIKHVDPGFMQALPQYDCRFELSSRDIKDIKDANKNLDGGDNPIRFHLSSGELKITIGDNQPNAIADQCTIIRPVNYEGPEFELIYTPSDFIFIDGDYEVYAYKHGLAVFKLAPIKVSDDEEVDFQLFYFLTTGLNG